MKHSPATRALVIAGALGLAAGMAQPASAVTVSDGTILQIDFDGSTADGDTVSGILDVIVNDLGGGIFDLVIKITNDTSALVGSTLNGFGFDLDPDSLSSIGVTNPAAGDFGDDQDGLSWALVSGNIPGFSVDQCISASVNCQASNDGLDEGLMDRLTINLAFSDATLTSFDLGPWAAKFGSIGTDQEDSLSVPGTTTLVSVPATLPLFLTGLLGLGFLARRRRQMAEA